MEYKRSEKLVLWIAAHSPKWLLEQPERVILNVMLLLTGVAIIAPQQPNSAIGTFPEFGRTLLGAVFVLGSLISLYGSVRLSRTADRIGALTLMGACAFLSILLFGTAGLRALITGMLFAGIAIAKLFRFIRAAALRIRIRHHLVQEKERMDQEDGS